VVVVLASEHQPDRMQELQGLFQPTATGLGRHQPGTWRFGPMFLEAERGAAGVS
jgi:hypothetical protein